MKKSSNDISVILPVFNGQNVISKCLNALAKQTIQNFNIVIINDGSTDETEEAVFKHMQNCSLNIKYVKQQNAGPGSARNSGLRLADGNFIVFVDADDEPQANYIKTLFYSIQTQDSDMAVGGYSVFANRGGKPAVREVRNTKRGVIERDELILEFLSNRIAVPLWASIYKKEIIYNNSLFFTDYCLRGEDLEFVAKYIFCCERIYIFNEVIYRFNYSSEREMKRTLSTLLELGLVYNRLAQYASQVSKNDAVLNLIRFELIPSDAIATVMAYAYTMKTQNEFIAMSTPFFHTIKELKRVRMGLYSYIKRKAMAFLAVHFHGAFFLLNKYLYYKIY